MMGFMFQSGSNHGSITVHGSRFTIFMSSPRSIWFSCCFLAGCYLVLSGCSTPHISDDRFEAVQRMNSHQPFPLYLCASPHPRLYVEADAVEGCVPTDADLAALRKFLVD